MDLINTIIKILNDPFGLAGEALEKWLRGFMPQAGVPVAMMVIRAAFVGIFALVMFMVMTWIERKGVARIQNRIGPNVAGPWGILQPIADAIKALTKEDITPDKADRLVYNVAPIMSAVAAMVVFAAIPFGPTLIGADLNVGVFYILAISAMGVLAILMAGWSSNNKYALLGGFRVVAQLVSYEVPHVLSIAAAVMLAGSMSLIDIVNAQSVWFIVALPVSAIIVMLSGMAEVGRSPFDLLDAESEIIAGHHIEYSGMKFALFFLAEYVHAFAVSCIVTALFLGGWDSPSPVTNAIAVVIVLVVIWMSTAGGRSSSGSEKGGVAGVIGVTAILGVVLIGFSVLADFGLKVPYLWFFAKSILVFNVMVWARGTLPRLRIDQLMAFNWKFLVPLSLANLIVVALADRLAKDVWGLESGSWPWALAMLAFNLAMLLVAFALAGTAGRRARLAAETPASEAEANEEHEEPVAHGEPTAVGAH
jgi:NADH-quinone oxidoreductase subunit H